MKRHRQHRKLFFPFGIISLAVLPVLGFQKIGEIYKSRTEPMHCIELTFPPSDTIFWGKQRGEKYSSIRKYKTFTLTSDTLQNNIVLNQARKLLNKIKEDKDTLNAVHIVLNDSTKYKDYIKAVDYSFEKFPGAFASYKNDFWTMYVYVDTTGRYARKRELERERELEKNGVHVLY